MFSAKHLIQSQACDTPSFSMILIRNRGSNIFFLCIKIRLFQRKGITIINNSLIPAPHLLGSPRPYVPTPILRCFTVTWEVLRLLGRKSTSPGKLIRSPYP